MAGRPLIGVSTYLEAGARWGVWELEAALLPAGYPRLVQRAGGLAAMLPPDAPEHAAATVARLDGLVIAGGPDVEPVRYGARPDPRTGPPARARDAWELALIEAALAARIPLLGICRGMQLLNVALGGTLVQHIDGHAEVPGVFGRRPREARAGHVVRRCRPGGDLGAHLPPPGGGPPRHGPDRLGARDGRDGGGGRAARPALGGGRAVASGDGRGRAGDAGAGRGGVLVDRTSPPTESGGGRAQTRELGAEMKAAPS